MRRRMRIPKAPRNQATFAVIFARSAFGVRMRPRIAFSTSWFYKSGSLLDTPDHGAGVCPFAEGVALGSSLPDSIIVGRTAPTGSGFGVRELGRRDSLVCWVRGSFLTGGVAETVGNSAALCSESDPPAAAGCGELRFSNRSAASAPAIRICSAVSVVEADFFSRDLGLVSAGAGDSDGVCSGACLGASGFSS